MVVRQSLSVAGLGHPGPISVDIRELWNDFGKCPSNSTKSGATSAMFGAMSANVWGVSANLGERVRPISAIFDNYARLCWRAILAVGQSCIHVRRELRTVYNPVPQGDTTRKCARLRLLTCLHSRRVAFRQPDLGGRIWGGQIGRGGGRPPLSTHKAHSEVFQNGRDLDMQPGESR